MSEGRVPSDFPLFVHFELPGAFIVQFCGWIVSSEQSIVERISVIYDERGIRVIIDEFMEVFILFKDITYHSSHESDIGSGAQWNMKIGSGRSPREFRVHMNDFGAPFLLRF